MMQDLMDKNASGRLSLISTPREGLSIVTPDQPCRELSRVFERLARSICAAHHECDMYDGYVNMHWPSFLTGAKASYLELLKIDEERLTKGEKNP